VSFKPTSSDSRGAGSASWLSSTSDGGGKADLCAAKGALTAEEALQRLGQTIVARKRRSWDGTTDGPLWLEWPKSWNWHRNDRTSLYCSCQDESVIVSADGEPTTRFFHFWASPREACCRQCGHPHPRISFRTEGSHAMAFGLFATPEGPEDGLSPTLVVCRDCAHDVWLASERFLDRLDAPHLV
jgi:hypothetical protein